MQEPSPASFETLRAPFDVVAIVASAGGLEAISAVLREIPADFPAAIVVAQHLGAQGSSLATILRRRTPLPVRWAEDGTPVRAGEVVLCPARHCLEILPDRTCALAALERGTHDRPLDCLLRSLADSLGPRALALVLTGMGNDGAAGALALREAGGTVIAQSEETAEQPSMPLAAVRNGAAELVLPLHELGRTVLDLARGGALPRPRAEVEATEALFAGKGETPRLLREIDWARTSLGPVAKWPASLRTALRVVLESPVPAIVLWGPDHVQLYNDHYRALMGVKHPLGLGRPNRECWPEVWHLNEPLYARVRAGEPVAIESALYPIVRSGVLEDAWFSLYFAPVRSESGEVAGILGTIIETTREVLSRRRLRALHALASESGGPSVHDAFRRAMASLSRFEEDVPFALGYFMDGTHRAALMAWTGVEEGGPLAPRTIGLVGGNAAWPLARVAEAGEPLLLTDLVDRFRGVTVDGGVLPAAALLLPLRSGADERPSGVLVAGISPRLPLDAAYRGFLELVGTQVEASVAEAEARERERARLEKLAELDRAKTEFFSNVSHEFRTPITLMLAPLEELVHRRDELPSPLGDEVEAASRNARRLVTLVDTLLDFSRIEEGRMRAHRESVDLAALTTDVASLFRGAAERAGLRLVVDCPPLAGPASVDPAMWEKVVSNLLSNALKFTFAGEVAVELRELPQHLELVVRDTGVGIPQTEIPNLFKRFHRVRGAQGRTHEGSGIGLALVNELVRLHHGRVRVKSREGEGSAFTVWIPKTVRTADETPAGAPVETAGTAAALAEIADRWDSPKGAPPEGALDEPLGVSIPIHGAGARVLVVDDNADLRDYLRRLLAPHWSVEAASDGTEALGRVRDGEFDLVLTDVMMPNLDGFGLLRAIRADERTRATPVVLLTARAGEEAAIEGLLAGADDYLVKPFSARELVARVGAQIELARVRGRAQELNAFLVRFSDAVRGLSDPHAVAQAACELVAERLGVERAYWAEVDWATREYAIGASFHAPDVPTIEGRFPVDAWEPFTSSQLAGRPVVVDDTQTDPRIPPEVKEGYAGIGVGADLAVPVTANGRLVCTLAVNQRLPRRWTPEEVALVASIASRCWAEVERARAEAALRISEERQAFLLGLSDTLRPLGDAFAIEREACRQLGERLGADHTYYAEIDVARDHGVVRYDYVRGGEAPFVAEYRVSDLGFVIPLYERGEPVVVDDVLTSPLIPDADRAATAASHVAWIAVPVVKDGVLVGSFCVAMRGRRAWKEGEVELVSETAERVWAAIERIRADEALRKSEERFRAMVNASSDVVYRMSADWSEMRALLGRGFLADTAAPNPHWLGEYIHPDDQPRVLQRIRQAIETKSPFEFEHRVLRADGTLGWTFSRAIPMLNEGGEIVEWFGTASDVTERKLAEARRSYLLELDDALRPIASPTEVEGIVTRAAMRHFGADRCYYCAIEGDVATIRRDAARPDLSSVAAVYPMAEMPIFRAMLRAQRPIVVADSTTSGAMDENLRALCLQAGILAYINVPVVKDGRLVGAFCLTQTTPRPWTRAEVEMAEETAERTWAAVERARAETALRESEGRYQALAANLPNGAAFVVGRDLRYLLAEGEALRTAGFTPTTFVGKTVREALDPDLAAEYEPHYRAALTGQTVRREHTAHGRRFVSHIGPLYDAEGGIYAALAVSYDVTASTQDGS